MVRQNNDAGYQIVHEWPVQRLSPTQESLSGIDAAFRGWTATRIRATGSFLRTTIGRRDRTTVPITAGTGRVAAGSTAETAFWRTAGGFLFTTDCRVLTALPRGIRGPE